MELNPKDKQDILDTCNLYFESLFSGDFDILSAVLSEKVQTIGTVKEEWAEGKNQLLKLLKETAVDFIGKVKTQNENITIKPVGEVVMVTVQSEFYVQIEDEWKFDSYYRSSLLLKQNKKENWKIHYGHFSVPDLRAEEGETLPIGELKRQNKKLKSEVEKRTAELKKQNAELSKALEELHNAQDQLVQQEKLASLGQLTAGIAHEIKNPLNFVNNFSDLSVELVEEARDELKSEREGKSGKVEEALEILNNIEANLKKIHEHGSRADGIVKSMLQHSRGGNGEMEPTDLNALIKEYVNLSFHGMRASENPINVDIEMKLDDSVGEIPLVAEDFSRVIINLCKNAFDAMREKEAADDSGQETGNYVPKLTVRTSRDNGQVTIEVEDNGPGIPEEMKGKILQPFFTTKQGKEGTGLGLSITNDIVKAHGGEIQIESQKDKFTCFKITINSN